jgi:hypothetical protein
MVNFASTQARAKEVAPSTSHEEGETKAIAVKPLSTSPPLTADGVDKMYRQLAEIHAITTVQLAECARWCRPDPSPSLARAGTGRQRPIVMPFAARLAPSAPIDFSSRAPLCGRTGASSIRPAARLARGARARYPSATHGACTRASIVTFS